MLYAIVYMFTSNFHRVSVVSCAYRDRDSFMAHSHRILTWYPDICITSLHDDMNFAGGLCLQLGSRGDVTFEQAILAEYPHCSMHTFDPTLDAETMQRVRQRCLLYDVHIYLCASSLSSPESLIQECP